MCMVLIPRGKRIYRRCDLCGKLVCINKFILKDLHVCLPPDER